LLPARASRAGWLQSGQPAAALSKVNALLEQLRGGLADRPVNETIGLRWRCQQVLDALGDERAAALLERLHADVLATAAERTDAADRNRPIQAIPTFRDIVAAWSAAAATRSA
jgi:HEAT repeat protein